MAPFDPHTDLEQDFHLIKNGPVLHYRDSDRLHGAVTLLARRGYLVHSFDAGAWTSQADFHRDIAAALDFPDYYGRNLDAFNDCLRDVGMYQYGASADAIGTVLVFTAYDAFARREPPAAQVILDIITRQAHFAMLFGHRLVCLVEQG